MSRYENGKIYMIEPICDHDEGDVYIGSTCKQYLSQRISRHKRDYKRWTNGNNNIYTSAYILFNKYGVDNCRIVLLEDFSCENKNQLLAKEAYYQKTMKCVNVIKPILTNDEFYEKYKQDRDKKNAYKSQQKECECGSIYTMAHYQRHCRTQKHQLFIAEKSSDITCPTELSNQEVDIK